MKNTAPMGTAISWRAKLAMRPWSFSLGYLIGSIALAIFVFEYSQPNWNPPREQELERADGYFIDQPRNATRPYLFLTDSGQKLMLGCSPEDLRTYCLANIGVPFASLIGHHAAIGFFRAHSPWWEFNRQTWPYALVTAEIDGRQIVSFDEGYTWLAQSDRMQRGVNSLMFYVGMGLALLFFYIGCEAAVAKLR